ncbi:hypothetical protein TNCT_589091 [Trichonephila clavata]|uniref:Uncharacterized protein n=1 Tax=Trichonephila clavata TaxID=2740835 RepID=A0A8X6LED4_TRICU|nr:hypothetical protein TNCT_589091 [Trichonephila clavata]
MSVQRFLKLEEALESLNSLDSDESEVDIAVLPLDTSEPNVKDKGDDKLVNTFKITVSHVPESLELKA